MYGKGKALKVVPATLLIDSNNLIRRCIHATALDDLQADGKYTGGIYGAWNSLSSFLRTCPQRIGRIIAFFDQGVPEWRMELVPEYKQERKEKQSMLPDGEWEKAVEQIGHTRDLFELLGVVCIGIQDWEADDGLALASRVLRDGKKPPVVIIYSNDKDLRQTVAWGTWVTYKDQFLTPDNFEEELALPPELYTLYRVLVGDSSDGLVGAEGCGDVRARKLLAEYREAYYDIGDVCLMEQFEGLVLYLEDKERQKGFEQGILKDHDRLLRELKAIDLDYRGDEPVALLQALDASPAPKPLGIRKFAQRFKMERPLQRDAYFIEPFMWAAKFRDGEE